MEKKDAQWKALQKLEASVDSRKNIQHKKLKVVVHLSISVTLIISKSGHMHDTRMLYKVNQNLSKKTTSNKYNFVKKK